MHCRRRVGGSLIGVCLIVLIGAWVLEVWAGTQDQDTRTMRVNPGMSQVLLDGQNSRAILAGTGSLQVIDTAHSTLVRTVTFSGGMVPPEVQMDDRDARVFVRTRGLAASGVGIVDAVNMFDTRTGQPLGTLPLPSGGLIAQFAVIPQTGRVFVLTSARHLFVFDARTGRRVNAFVLYRRADAPPMAPANPADTLVVDQRTGRVIVTESDQGTVFVLDGASGRVLWTTSLPTWGGHSSRLWLPVVDEQHEHLFVDDIRTGTIGMLDLRTGHLDRYTVRVNPGYVDMVAIRRTGRVFVFDGGRMSVLDGSSGLLVRASRLGRVYQFVSATVVQRTGSILLQDATANNLLVLDGVKGRIKHVLPLTQFTMLAVDEHTGHVLITGLANSRASTINVLDAWTGSLLHAITVGPGLSIVSTDDRTGEIAILSNGPITVPDRWAWVPSQLRSALPFLRQPITTTLG